MKTPATALAVATDLPGTTKGALFCEGTKNDGTANGFKNDKKFVEIYHASLADGKVDNKAGNLTVKDAATASKGTVAYNGTNVDMTAVPTIKKGPAGKAVQAGFVFTVTATIKPKKPSSFFTNGKYYSLAVMTLDQNTPSAAAGIGFTKDKAAASFAATWSGKPTISSTLAKPNFDGVAADSYSYYTNSGMAFTSGTVTASNSTVQAFKVGANGSFGINVTHSATLKDAITTTAI